MGKRKKLAGGNSKESTPAGSDTDDPSPRSRRHKPVIKKRDRSSAELCKEFGVTDVDLEYTEADYQNLTTFSFFVRMVRPQISAANPRVAAAKMTSILEAKWKEFREAKKVFDQQKKVEKAKAEADKLKETAEAVAEEVKRQQEKEDEEDAETEIEEDVAEEDSTKADSDDEHAEVDSTRESDGRADSDKTEEDSLSEEDSEEIKPRRGSVKKTVFKPLRIKMPIPMRKSAREKKSKKVMTDYDFEKLLGSDEDQAAWASGADKSRKKRGKKRPDWDNDSETDEDDEFVSKSRKRKRTESKKSREPRRTKTPQYDSENSSMLNSRDNSSSAFSSTSDSENSGTERKTKRKRKHTERERVHIPGERRSERAKRSLNTTRDMTDREFEKMMKREEQEKQETIKKKKKQDKAKKKAREREQDAKKKLEIDGRKGYWQDNADPGNESDHCWFCSICKDGGDLLLCDTCPMAFHKDCLKIGVVPEGDWSCPKCTGEGLEAYLRADDEEEEEEDHFSYCKVCHDGGDVLLCDFCPFVYHQKCLNPPLTEVPEGDWKCPRCVIQEKPLKGKVKQILTWRWSHQLKGADELDHTHTPRKKSIEQLMTEENTTKTGKVVEKSPERELFVKFEYHSYWDCEWISELALEVFQPLTHTSFRKRWDQDEPPALEDGSSFGRLRHKSDKDEDDPHNLEDKYYRYGVKPEWLIIHRIIAHDGQGKNLRYLVKWKDLLYEDCTWEYPSEIPAGLEDWSKHVDAYWTHRKEKLKDAKDVKKKKLAKKSSLKKKLEEQPQYMGTSGGKLHAYQLEGLNWMRFSWAQDTNTILADEMGLGKTIQAIALVYHLWKEGFVSGPFLISAPLSTVPNWEREFTLWAPDMYVVTYNGLKENRAVIRERDFSYKEDAFPFYHKAAKLREGHKPKFDVLLTSYEMVSLDQATLMSIHWSILIIDEAHRLKSQQSLFFKTMSAFQLDYKLLLTGTPLQNNLEELFNLLTFLEPQKFDDMTTFLEQFSEISKDEQVTKLHQMLAPHMLRRMKTDVMKDLPSKGEFIVRVELSPLQKKFYKHILTRNFEALNVKGMSNQTSLINIMMDLRKCCNHPFLFPAAVAEVPQMPNGAYEGSALMKASGKLELLSMMLDKLRRDNHRVLIFSQMTRVLDLLEDFMEYKKFGYERIDGSITGGRRQEAIDRFNSPDSKQFVFLLSTKAGGLGINLATADTVIIFDMDWNPHNDIQAFSRAHRIGQTNKVMIFRFVCKNTVEEKIAEVCKKKMMLTQLVIHRGMGAPEKKESLSKQEVNAILKYGAEKLFKDDEEGKVVYDDAAVETLLDRSNVGEVPEEQVEQEKVQGMNEYLHSFKVASYNVKEGQEEVEEEEEDEEKEKEREPDETSQQYWQRVLGSEFDSFLLEKHQEEERRIASLGKGKRTRKKINYAETRAIEEMMHARREEESLGRKKDMEFLPSDYESSETSSSDSGKEDDDVMDDSARGIKAKKHSRVPREAFPALVARVNNQIEVLSFTPRQRRVFLDTVMKFGMPPDDPYRSQWLTRELRSKPEKVFKAYCALFLRHLCEVVPESVDHFADGVPCEGLSRKHVLTRIGIIALIRRKVQQFEKKNGVDSLKEFHRQQPAVINLQNLLITDPTAQQAKREVNHDGQTDDKKGRDPDAVIVIKADDKKQMKETRDGEDKESGDVTDKNKESGDVTDKNKESGDVTDKNKESGDVTDKDKESGDVTDKESGDVTDKDKESGDVTDKDKESGDVTDKDKESGGVTDKDKESDGVTDKDKESDDVTDKDKESGDVTDKDKESDDVADKDKESGDVTKKESGDVTNKESDVTDKDKESGDVIEEDMESGDVTDKRGECSSDDEGKQEAKGKSADEVKSGVVADDGSDTDHSEEKRESQNKFTADGEGDVISQVDGPMDDDDSSDDEKQMADDAATGSQHSEQTETSVSEEPQQSTETSVSEEQPQTETSVSEEHRQTETSTSEEQPQTETSVSEEQPQTETSVSEEQPQAETSVGEEQPQTETSVSKEQPQTETSTSEEQPQTETSISEEQPQTETSVSEKQLQTETSVSEEQLQTETSVSEEQPQTETSVSEEQPQTETSVSKEQPQTETSVSKEQPQTETSVSKEQPQAETSVSEEQPQQSTEIEDREKLGVAKDEKSTGREKDSSGGAAKMDVEEADQSPLSTPDDAKSQQERGPQTKTVKTLPKAASSVLVVSPSEQKNSKAKKMRRTFWIADGGFTELHALWTYEERHLTEGLEYQTWHRRHDFWLLAGIVTHGYRHWQDILNDSRFEILNRAFRTEGEVMRKAAFLNRRFQLLEQALVIEEQLRKTALDYDITINCPHSGPEHSPHSGTELSSDSYSLDKLDILAEDLRRVNQGEKPLYSSPADKLLSVWTSVSQLIQDVRQGTFSTMPATLAKPPSQPPKAPGVSLLSKPIQPAPKRDPGTIICID